MSTAMEQPEPPLLLKVMRLRQTNTLAPAIDGTAKGALDVPKLALPMALKQSMVGELFTGYLHISNTSSQVVRDARLVVELVIGSSKYTLYSNAVSPVAMLPPGEFFDALVEHSLRDAGSYVLNCNLSYTSASGEQGQFKRSYRFPVMMPFAISHRVVQLDSQLLVECSVALDEKHPGSIYLSSWQLDCAESLIARPLGASGREEEREGSRMQLLKPGGSHSLVFSVEQSEASVDLRQLDFIGALSLGWRVLDGSAGCIEGHQIRVKALQVPGLELQVVTCPRQVEIEVPFKLELEVINSTAVAIEPKVHFDLRLMGAVKIHGTAQRTLTSLEPGGRQRLPVELLVTMPGLHSLQGVSLSDGSARARTEFGVLCDILAF